MGRMIHWKPLTATKFGRRLVLVLGVVVGSMLPIVYYGMCFVFRAGHFDIIKPRPNASEEAKSRHRVLCEQSRFMQPRLVFLGDSITEGWSTHGLRVWQSELEGFGAFNMGVSGDRIQNLLWRINHGALDVINPVGIVVAIGTNNARFYSAREIVRGLHAVVERIHRQHPNAAIIVLSLLPRDTPNSHQRNIVMQVNSELSESFKEVEFAEVVDVGKAFVDDADEIVKDLMPDSLHPSENGYRELARCLRPFLLQIDEQLVRKTDTSSKGRSSDVGISADDR